MMYLLLWLVVGIAVVVVTVYVYSSDSQQEYFEWDDLALMLFFLVMWPLLLFFLIKRKLEDIKIKNPFYKEKKNNEREA